MKPNIDYINPVELLDNKAMLSEIRFDCLLKMYDFGQIQPDGSLLYQPKPLPPQWFALSHRFTLDFFRTSDEYQIGRVIKDAFNMLEEHIKNYEKNRK